MDALRTSRLQILEHAGLDCFPARSLRSCRLVMLGRPPSDPQVPRADDPVAHPVVVAGRVVATELPPTAAESPSPGDLSGHDDLPGLSVLCLEAQRAPLSARICLEDDTATRWLELTVALPSVSTLLAQRAGERSPFLAPERLLPWLRPGDRVDALLLRDLTGSGWRVAAMRILVVAQAPPSERVPLLARTPGGGASLGLLRRRASILAAIRDFFARLEFVEVETPILSLHAGLEPHLDPFVTRYRSSVQEAGRPAYLLTSPEYALKRLLVAGLERVFQFSKVFRNGELGAFHNPEFTMLEWYRAYASYEEIMADLEGLVLELTLRLGQGSRLRWQGHEVELSPPWPRLTVAEAFRRHAGIALEACPDLSALQSAAVTAGYSLDGCRSWEEAFFQVLVDRVEPHLGFGRPVFLIDYPAPFAALARLKSGRVVPVAERFELYIAGVEVGNAYSELNDPRVQRRRFEEEQAGRRALGALELEPDPQYLEALEEGLPPTGGIAVGIDRLVMLLLDARDTRATLAFPFSLPQAGSV